MKKTTLALLGAMIAGLGATPAFSQAPYPSRPIQLIVGLAPGGLADLLARLLAPGLSAELGQSVVVENRTGLYRATNYVGAAAPDGHTLMVVLDATLVMRPAMDDKAPFDPTKDFTPIARLVEAPLAIFSHPSVPAKDFRQLVELIRSKGAGKEMLYGSANLGSSGHLVGEYLKQLVGIQMTHVAYKGASEAMRDTLGGQIPLMISSVGTALGSVKSGQLGVVAVTGDRRLPTLPNVPTVAESGIAAVSNFNVKAWGAIVAPPGTPEPIVRRIHDAAAKIFADPEVVKKLEAQDVSVSLSSPAELGQQIAAELVQWRKVVKEAGIQPD